MPESSRLQRRSEDWYIEPPPTPDLTTLEVEQARVWLEEFKDWTTAAISHLRYVVAKLRARGKSENVDKLIDAYAAGSRQAYESRANILRYAENARQVARDLRAKGGEIAAGPFPDIAAPLYAKAEEAEIRADLIAQSAECHRALVEAYSEALKGLASVRNESSESDLIFHLIGPAMGGAVLVGLFVPTIWGVAVGTTMGIAAGLTHHREVMRREAE